MQSRFSERVPDDAALVRRIENLERTVRELGPSVAGSFGPAIAELQSQQAEISAAVADISALVGQQTTPGTASGTTGTGVALTDAWADYAVATLTVPASFTKAQVVGISSTYMGGAGMKMRTGIGGAYGDEMNLIPEAASGLCNGSSSFSRVLTGLTGGSTISVVTSAIRIGTNTAYMTTTAFATFYR